MKVICIALFLALAQYSAGTPIFNLPPIEDRILDPYMMRMDPRMEIRRIRLGEEPFDFLPYDMIDSRFDGVLPVEFFNRIPQLPVDRIFQHRPIVRDFDLPELFRPFKRVTTVEEFLVDERRPIDTEIIVPVVPEKVPETTVVEEKLPIITETVSTTVEPIINKVTTV